jgi:hypothetical protein
MAARRSPCRVRYTNPAGLCRLDGLGRNRLIRLDLVLAYVRSGHVLDITVNAAQIAASRPVTPGAKPSDYENNSIVQVALVPPARDRRASLVTSGHSRDSARAT